MRRTDKMRFHCTYNFFNGWWRTFYYTEGNGFSRGEEVYCGRNDWRDEKSAQEAKARWEARNGDEVQK